jgi:hypothetical protein
MKQFILILTILFIYQGSFAFEKPLNDKDTVIIRFGNSSRIVIYVKDKKDLDLLRQYDINGMLKDLSIVIDSTEDNTYLKIEDKTGERYLKDTTIIIEDIRVEKDANFEDDEDNSASANVRIGNIEVTVDNLDDMDQIEKDFEDFENFEKKEYETKRSIGTSHSFNMDFGMNNWLTNGNFPESNQNYAVKPWGSWYIGLTSTHKTSISGPFFLEWGGGIDWYNFKLENRSVKITQGDEMVEFTEITDLDALKSKLTVNYINLKLVPMLDFSYGRKLVKEFGNGSVKITRYKKRGFRVGAGVYGGYRIGSYSKFVYEDGGKEKEHLKKSFYIDNWRYGVRIQMGFKGTDIFFNYDLNRLFREGRGPELHPISFGITI